MRTRRTTQLSIENLLLRVPKNFVGHPFCVSRSFWYLKNHGLDGGNDYHDYP